MSAYADSGLLVSLYLPEVTTAAASVAVGGVGPLPLTPLGSLEMRNAVNFAVNRGRITLQDQALVRQQIQSEISSGFYTEVQVPQLDLHRLAQQLSDRHTPTLATRSLDLLHVAAAILLGATDFLSFDLRQRQAAVAEGLRVLP